MRSLALASALALALLAGCLNSPPDSIPAGTTPTAASPTPTPGGSSSDGPHPGGAMLVRPAHNESSSGDVTLLGDESASGFIGGEGAVTFTFQARNDGSTNATARGGCVQDPAVHVEDDNGTTLALDPPTARCMAFTLVPMAPGASLWTNLTWNGTAYDGSTPRTVAPGTYWAVATFTADRDGAPITVESRVPVNVLDASARGAL